MVDIFQAKLFRPGQLIIRPLGQNGGHIGLPGILREDARLIVPVAQAEQLSQE